MKGVWCWNGDTEFRNRERWAAIADWKLELEARTQGIPANSPDPKPVKAHMVGSKADGFDKHAINTLEKEKGLRERGQTSAALIFWKPQAVRRQLEVERLRTIDQREGHHELSFRSGGIFNTG